MTHSSSDRLDIGVLISAAQRNEVGARDEVVRRLYPRVQRLVHHRLQVSIRRDNPWVRALFSTGDVVHDVFIGLLGSASDVADRGEEAVIRFLAVAVQNRLLDMMRHHRALRRDARRRASTSAGGANPDQFATPRGGPLSDLGAQEKVGVYRELVDSLPSKYRVILRMRLEHGQSFAEVASVMGLPTADAARKMFHYAHAKLLALLIARGISPDDLEATDV